MKAVIFAGGVGTRLWPLSRKSSPKQFENVIGAKSTLQLASDRLLPDFSYSDIYVSTGKSYVDIVKRQLPAVPPKQIIGEPQMRDVGPAVGLMTAILRKESPQEPMTILWSDHLVKKESLFREILALSNEYIKNNPNKIIFISQKPRFASQNLGWVEYGEKIPEQSKFPLYKFVSFKYRPDLSLAEKYFASGHHAWNLGYFVTTPEYLWNQYRRHAPNMFKILEEIHTAWGTDLFERVLEEKYPLLEKISFDNAIIEKIDPNDALVISENLHWSDVGAWEALKEALQKHQAENVTNGKTLLTDSQASLVFTYTDKLMVGIDLNGLLVINTQDVVLICSKDSVPKIKKLVESFSGTEYENLT